MVVLSNNFARGGRPGGDKRGNAAQRRARKGYLLTLWGDGQFAPCLYCDKTLDFHTVEADRILAGDTYARHNIIPACRECNVARSDKTLWSFAPKVARKLHRKGYAVSAA